MISPLWDRPASILRRRMFRMKKPSWSAHRDLPELVKFLGELEASGEKAVILAVAGCPPPFPAWW